MKIKVLLVPSIIVLSIILGIWIIYPAYSNGSTGARDLYDQLTKERVKLNSILGESGNASKLSAQLDTISSDKDVLYEFIPSDMKESEIIDNLNKMASDSGLLIYGLSVSQPILSVATIDVPQTMGSTSLDATGPVDAAGIPVSVLPVAKSFEADMQISGSYDQIKNFLEKMNVFARYNTEASVSLKKGLSASTDGSSSADASTASLDVLTADLKINFNVLEKAKLSEGNVNDSVFSSSTLDTQVISQIKSRYSGTALKLDIGQTGKTNPFIP